ncbi:MAG: pyridoxamine 5'-phosphate oxidase family protein [Gammaproteobacteria bacterium]|nr:pyridoxamine 5'-phosphate oxidase family protein [Gammaproteobacteria bacterium]
MAAISPFHRGEREIQSRVDMREQIEDVGQRFIRDYFPDQHREFYAELPYLVVGSVDAQGQPWASLLSGKPGFITPEARSLTIATQPTFGDPLNETLVEGVRLGFLGIDYEARRRNRFTGRLLKVDDNGIHVRVDQTFGNCPKYIQARSVEFGSVLDSLGEERVVHQMDRLDERSREIIAQADHFFIATNYSADDEDIAQGTDASHRGGKPGFVRIDDDTTLTFPDFTGNYHFNTLGNIQQNPVAGLLFIDFVTRDLLYVACAAEVLWEGDELTAFTGAEQLVRFTVKQVRLVENALPLSFSLIDYSPFIEQTGSWEAVAERQAAREIGNTFRNYIVARVEPESENITSFYLSPSDDSNVVCHSAGQFLPIEICPPGTEQPVYRTYTISNAPNGEYFRLSIKREISSSGKPPGVVSNFFHDNIEAGATIRALNPRGQFSLDRSSTRSVVLISAGVGVTPMISMLEQLDSDRQTCGCTRKVWFIHGARHGGERAFRGFVHETADAWPNLEKHIRFSRPTENDVQGRDYDSVGRVDVALLKSLLPFDDYEFYICGPGLFMESIYEDLKEMNIADQRIHYEYFAEGKALAPTRPDHGPAMNLEGRGPVPVRFAKSGVDVTWDADEGTLLDLAESKGIEAAYSCRSGVCQTCAISVLEGSVDYSDPPAAPPPEGMALICTAYPVARDAGGADSAPLVLDI